MNVKMKISNQNTEKKVLNLLFRFGEVIDMAMTYGLEEEDFSTPMNRYLFTYVIEKYLEENFVPIDDFENFINQMYYEDDADKNETIVYVNKIMKLKVKAAGVTTEVNVKMLPKYIDELKSLTIVRKIITGVNRVQATLMEEESSHHDLISVVHDNLGNMFDRGKGIVRKNMKEATRETIEEIVEESEGKGGIRLGLNADVDANAKVMKGYLTYVAGAPGIGKSALANNIATNIAEQDYKLLYVTQEMNVNDNIKRMLAFKQNIKSSKLQNPKLLDVKDWTKLDDVLSKDLFSELGIHWFSQEGLTVSELQSEISKYVRLHDIDVVIIDYYQLVKFTNEYEMSEGVEIPKVSAGLRETAKQFYINPVGQSKQVAIIALSQVVKEVERREDKRPTMNDLYYGGAKDARLVLAIFRDDYYNPDETDKPNIMEIGIVKQNNGIMGMWFDSYFDGTIQKIRDLTEDERDLLPTDEDYDDNEDGEYEDEE